MTAEASDSRYMSWTSNTVLNSSTFTSAFMDTQRCVVYRMGFKANSSKLEMKIIVDGIDKYHLDIGQFTSDFQGSSNFVSSDELFIRQYHPNVWVFDPPVNMRINESIDVQFKLTSGNNKKILEGYTLWGIE